MKKTKIQELADALGVGVEVLAVNADAKLKDYEPIVLTPYWTTELGRFVRGEGGYSVGTDFTVLNYSHASRRGPGKAALQFRRLASGLLIEINPQGK